MIRVYVEGVGLAGPGLAGWPGSRAVLAGLETYVPAAAVVTAPRQLPPAESRRTGVPVRLALAVAHEAFAHAGRDAASTATVFASSSGDGDNVHEILETLASPDRALSPTRFHNAVHNAAAGYWSIAVRCHEPSTSLCAYDASFAAGLLDAATQVAVEQKPVALIVYDHPYPQPLHAKRPLGGSFAAALILAPARGAQGSAALDIAIAPGNAPVTTVANGALEALRTSNPAARCLPLLAALARALSETIHVEYVAASRLCVGITRCD